MSESHLERWHRIWDTYGVDWERDDLIAAYLDGRLPYDEVRDLRDADGRYLLDPWSTRVLRAVP